MKPECMYVYESYAPFAYMLVLYMNTNTILHYSYYYYRDAAVVLSHQNSA